MYDLDVRIVRRSLAVGVVGIAACIAAYPNLGSSTEEVVVLDVTMYNFGTLPVGMSSTSSAITISPQSGSDDDTVTFIDMATSCPDFSVQPVGSLPARIYFDCNTMSASGSGSNCIPRTFQFTTRFAPSAPGAQSCNVRIDYRPTGTGSGSNLASKLVMLTGSGATPPFKMEVAPMSLEFQDVAVGTTSTEQPVVVKNTGSMAFTIQGTISGQYTETGASLGSHTLNAGSQETYRVACQPTLVGDAAGTLSFTTVQGPTGAVNLSCRGIVTTLTVQPSVVRFDSTLVGAAPPDKVVTISNGSASPPVMLTNFRFTTGTSAEVSFVGTPPNGTTLSPGGSTQVALRYAADTAHASGPLGSLVFAGNGSDQNVGISGEAQIGSIGTNPASVEFGPVCPGAPLMRDVAIFANASGDVDVSSLSPPSAPSLSVPNQSGGLKGNHGTELTARVTLMPLTAATIDDKFVINSNVPGAPTHEVPITATVLAAGISPTPDKVHFGPGMINMTTTGREVTISNCGTGMLSVTGASIAGVDAADFTIASPASPERELAPAESMTFLIVMTPHSVGTKTAQLVVEHSQGTTSADLDGDGYGGVGDGDKDRETYYACSTGGGTARAWPIALALLALRRRRR